MIDTELRELFAQPLDQALDGLERDIWQHVAASERLKHASRRILVLQAMLLGIAFATSTAAGMYWARAGESSELGVFSPQMPLNASVLLSGEQP